MVSLGLGINAGHDLNLENLPRMRNLPGLREVSIGHHLMAHALYVGLEQSVKDSRGSGLWTTVGNLPGGIHKKWLAGYIALCEFRINSKVITAEFIQNSSLALNLNMSQNLIDSCLLDSVRA